MALYSKIYSLLSGSTRITDVTSARIYPVLLPPGTAAAFPAVSYQRISADRVYSLSAYSTLENPRIQMDAWATTYEDVKKLSTRIKTTMEGATGFSAILLNDEDLYEDALELYRVTMDFSVWNQE